MSDWLLVVLCAATGAYCLVRRVRMRRGGALREGREAGGEAVMAFGMAAMGVPAAVLPPPAWMWVVYAAVFGAASVRAAWAARKRRAICTIWWGRWRWCTWRCRCRARGRLATRAGTPGIAGAGCPW